MAWTFQPLISCYASPSYFYNLLSLWGEVKSYCDFQNSVESQLGWGALRPHLVDCLPSLCSWGGTPHIWYFLGQIKHVAKFDIKKIEEWGTCGALGEVNQILETRVTQAHFLGGPGSCCHPVPSPMTNLYPSGFIGTKKQNRPKDDLCHQNGLILLCKCQGFPLDQSHHQL